MSHLACLFRQGFQSTNVVNKIKKQLWTGWLGMGLTILPVACTPALGAERIYLSYGALGRSIPIEALEIYAKEGRISRDLVTYTRYFNDQQLAQLRTGLQTRINLDPVTISQFLYSPAGERLLQRLGQIIQTPSRQSGFYAIRAALILAAADPEGMTALNLMRKFPTQGIRIDLGLSLAILKEVERLVNQTAIAVATVRSQSQAQVNTGQGDTSQLHGLQFRGPFGWQKETLKFDDPSRTGLGSVPRTFLADIYLPNVVDRPLSVIVFSHGLGEDRLTFEYLAEHLASHGFVVAVPDHPGSGAQQLRALVNGQADEAADPTEFVNRPLDVKFLLDELGRRSANAGPPYPGVPTILSKDGYPTPKPGVPARPQADPIYNKRLNLQQVGVIGHSFGGYTALALAGAKLNFEQLQKDCGTNLNRSLNVSLLLQCRALALPKRNYDLFDPRVKAVVAINPMDSSIFGQPGLSAIKVPTMLIAGSADTVTPALLEQIQPFTWLVTPQKYLLVIEGGTHFSTIGKSASTTGVFSLPPALTGPATGLARRYLNALSVAFSQTYVANQTAYARYLTPAYTRAISQPPLTLSISQTLTAADLEGVLGINLPGTAATRSQVQLERKASE